MKKTVYFLLIFLIGGAATVCGQVTIGSTDDPHPAAVLDLQSTDKGLLLPRVSLTDVNTFLPTSSDSEEKASAVGLLVFNDGAAVSGLDAGIYIWTGSKWKAVLITANTGDDLSDDPNKVSNPDVLGTE
ncbi:MAG: hypothetical protein LBG15_02870 [Dysgonamonadaceae bacterium]|jgi:hypothetical protein|nr:hypothetical protein [Dysgonamonadaceae bacterium]